MALGVIRGEGEGRFGGLWLMMFPLEIVREPATNKGGFRQNTVFFMLD